MPCYIPRIIDFRYARHSGPVSYELFEALERIQVHRLGNLINAEKGPLKTVPWERGKGTHKIPPARNEQ